MYRVQTIEATPPRAEVRLVPMTPALLPQVTAAAQADAGHILIAPSHAVMRSNEAVGYASLAVVPMFFAWLDTNKLSAPESFRAWRAAEEILKGQGTVCLPCTDSSPLLPFVSKKGYHRVGTAHLHLKEF